MQFTVPTVMLCISIVVMGTFFILGRKTQRKVLNNAVA
jgi:hypothetical protein